MPPWLVRALGIVVALLLVSGLFLLAFAKSGLW